jgi:hypothetical protein
MAAGVLLPHLLVGALFLASGSFRPYLDAVLLELPRYARLAPEPGLFYSAGRLAPAAVAAVLLAAARFRGRRPPLAALGPAWLAFALAGATSSPWAFPHYLQQLAPPLALTVATLPVRRLPTVAPLEAAGITAAAVVGLAALVTHFEPSFSWRQQVRPAPYYRAALDHAAGRLSEYEYTLGFNGNVFTVRDIADAIERQPPPAGEGLFVWGELPWLYPATGLTNSGGYYTTLLGAGIPGAREAIMARLRSEPPSYIVISRESKDVFEQLETFARQRYTLTDEGNDWRLFRLTP